MQRLQSGIGKSTRLPDMILLCRTLDHAKGLNEIAGILPGAETAERPLHHDPVLARQAPSVELDAEPATAKSLFLEHGQHVVSRIGVAAIDPDAHVRDHRRVGRLLPVGRIS